MSKFSLPVRIYYEDTDAGGVVFYANYLKYFERARTEWLRTLGINQQDINKQYKVIFVVKTCTVEYHAPARLDDEISITTEIQKIGRASIVFLQSAWKGEILLASATVVVCCVSIEKWAAFPIPESVIEKINEKKQSTL